MSELRPFRQAEAASPQVVGSKEERVEAASKNIGRWGTILANSLLLVRIRHSSLLPGHVGPMACLSMFHSWLSEKKNMCVCIHTLTVCSTDRKDVQCTIYHIIINSLFHCKSKSILTVCFCWFLPKFVFVANIGSWFKNEHTSDISVSWYFYLH